MVRYDFRCECGTTTEADFGMREAPPSIESACCGQPARRQFGATRLRVANSPAYQAIEYAARSADQPPVVTGSAPGARRRPAYSTNPLHQRLPRP